MLTRLIPSIMPAPAIPVAWDETPCPLCRTNSADMILEARDPNPSEGSQGMVFAVVKCRQCGLIYTNPRPDEKSIGGFYNADYKPHRRPTKIRHATVARSWRAKLFGRTRPEGRGDLPWPGPGRLLDFGCGAGSFLKRMADRGWTVIGLDASVGAVNRIQEELGLTALVGTLPHPDLTPGTFDIVTMWHSIEHVHDPLAILREAFQLLKPGGKLVVACPNINSWAFQWFGPSWFALDLPRHLTHFTPKTLGNMLATAGYETETMKVIRHSDWLRSSARLAVKTGRAGVFQKPLTWKPLAKVVAWVTHAFGKSDCLMAVAHRPA